MSDKKFETLLVEESCKAAAGELAEENDTDRDEMFDECESVMTEIAENGVGPGELGDKIDKELGDGAFDAIQDMFDTAMEEGS